MGCGSSTTVQTIEPSKNRTGSGYNHQRQTSPKPAKRHSRKSSSSSSSSDSSKSAKERVKSGGSRTSIKPVPADPIKHVPDENENIQSLNKDRDEKDSQLNHTPAKTDGDLTHDELQTEVFITGNYRKDEIKAEETPAKQAEVKQVAAKDEKVPDDQGQKKNLNHEEIAEKKERHRQSLDYEAEEYEMVIADGYDPIDIPEMGPNEGLPVYTVDDIVAHNAGAMKDWFRMGRKVYSLNTMLPIIETRLQQYAAKTTYMLNRHGGYPPYMARNYYVTRRELRAILDTCQIGNYADVTRDRYVSSLLESVNAILESVENDCPDYMDQLKRWKDQYPENFLKNGSPDVSQDPNALEFPLPPEVKKDPLVFRPWGPEFTWDTELADDIWDNSEKCFTDLCENANEKFAEAIAADHGPEDTFAFDTSIDGTVGWSEIECDLFKNDVTTPSQEDVWKKRSLRKDLDDENRMERRRQTIADSLTRRHEWSPEKVLPFLAFTQNLKTSWEAFQALCEKEWNPPPPKKVPDVSKGMGSQQSGKKESHADTLKLDDSQNNRDSDIDQNDRENTGLDIGPAHRNEDDMFGSGEMDQRTGSASSLQPADLDLDGDQGPTLETNDSGLDLNTPELMSARRSH